MRKNMSDHYKGRSEEIESITLLILTKHLLNRFIVIHGLDDKNGHFMKGKIHSSSYIYK